MSSGAFPTYDDTEENETADCSHETPRQSSSDILTSQEPPEDLIEHIKKSSRRTAKVQSANGDLVSSGLSSHDFLERRDSSIHSATMSSSSISIALSDYSDSSSTMSTRSEASPSSVRATQRTSVAVPIATIWSPVTRRVVGSPRSYVRANTYANLEAKLYGSSIKRENSSGLLHATPSAGELSMDQNAAGLPTPANSKDYFTELDSILANIDTIQGTRERSFSEPFANSWSYHSSSPIVPITHPRLKQQLAKRNKPVRQVSKLFKPTCATPPLPDAVTEPLHRQSLPTLATTSLADPLKPKKRKLKSSERPKKEKRKSTEPTTGDTSDAGITPRSSKSKSRSAGRPPKGNHISSSSSHSSLSVASPEKKAFFAEDRPFSQHLKSLGPSPLTSPSGSPPLSFSPLSARSLNSAVNTWDSDSEDSMPSSSRDSTREILPPRTSPLNSSGTLLEPKSARLSTKDGRRTRAKSGDSVYFTDNDSAHSKNKSKRRSGSSLALDDIPLPDLSRRRNKTKSFEIVAPVSPLRPRSTPSSIWLSNKANVLDAHNFFQYLQTNIKDSQFCEAVILMHSEVCSSRYLLENLLLLYNQPHSPSSPVSSSSSSSLSTTPTNSLTQTQPISLSSSIRISPRSYSEESDADSTSSKKILSTSLPLKTILVADPGSSQTTLRTAIINFLKKWVRLNTQDFTDDSSLQDMFRNFVNDLKRKPGIECQMGGLIWDLFESSLQKLDDDPNILPLSNSDTLLLLGKPIDDDWTTSPGTSPRGRTTPKSKPLSPLASLTIPSHLLKFNEFPAPYLGRDAVASMSSNLPLSVLDISPVELARQWCLMDHTAFSQVRFRDFLRFASQPESSESLGRLAGGFNHATSWVAVQILRIENPKKRSRMVAHMISLADELLQLNNYHAFFGVVIGLTQLSIGRLRLTWKQLGKKDLKTLSTLQQMASPLSNFAALRHVHDSVPPPFVPLPSLFLRDLVMLAESSHEGFINPANGQVNKEKILIIEKLLGRLHSAQRNHYKFVPIKSIQQLLQQGIAITSEELEAWSTRVEPGRELV